MDNSEQVQTKRGRGRPKKHQIVEEKKKDKRKTYPILNDEQDENEEIVANMKISAEELNRMLNSDSSETTDEVIVDDMSESSINATESYKFISNNVKKPVKEELLLVENVKVVDANNPLKIKKLDINFVDMDDGKVVINKTDVACWWCTEKFKTYPCFLPMSYLNKKYNVMGCFCGYSCSAAYNLYYINDYKSKERHSLIKQLYYELTGEEEIKIAYEKEVLIKYGGYMTIEEYRKNLAMYKDIRLMIPPLTPIIPYIVEKEVIKSQNNGLILKRNKPLPTQHFSLKDAMNIMK